MVDLSIYREKDIVLTISYPIEMVTREFLDMFCELWGKERRADFIIMSHNDREYGAWDMVWGWEYSASVHFTRPYGFIKFSD